MITGKELINLGYKQGEWVKETIGYANGKKLHGQNLINFLETPKHIQILPRSKPAKFYRNIRAESDEEILNLKSVVDAIKELMKTPTLVEGAIMPDACPTGENQTPVGIVVIAKNAIHPSIHSADICCSVMMTNLGNVDPKKVLDNAHLVTHFGVGGRREFSDLPKELEEEISENMYLKKKRSIELAKSHLGTQGDGNHFLSVGVSKKTGDTIMVTHHGSRGFGANLYRQGLKVAELFRKEISPKTPPHYAWIPFETKEGKEYWDALQIIRKWTKLNHKIIHEAVTKKLKAEVVDRFWNEHNFVFRMNELFYHAKGATPLDDKFIPDSKNGLRLIPLSMNEPILIVRGKTTENNLGFAPHGAGRDISRLEYKKKNLGRDKEEVFAEETKGLDVRFFSGNIDISELPSAYKNARKVKNQIQEFGLGEVVDEIIPYGCIMAGESTRRKK